MFQTRTVRSYDPVMRTGNAGCESVSLNCKHMTPSVWPFSVRTVHLPLRQFRSMVIRSLYTSFHGRVTDSGRGRGGLGASSEHEDGSVHDGGSSSSDCVSEEDEEGTEFG